MVASRLGSSLLLATLLLVPSLSQRALGQQPTEFDGKRAYGYLQAMCNLGNRMSGSPGMAKQQQLIIGHFAQLKLKLDQQRFRVRHPLDGKPVPMANLIVTCFPEREKRILLCAHYDTRPLPSEDPNPRMRESGVFLGANDGASGAAVLMEIAHHVKSLPDRYGLDLVFFDGEELVYVDGRDRYFLGSEFFAHQYVQREDEYEYVAGVLLDMVGDRELSIYQEGNSVRWSDSRPIVEGIWTTAANLGVKEFIPQVKYEVLDDHLPLHNIAKIPICDVIDFKYPDPRSILDARIPGGGAYWHTVQDTPGHCSAESLGKVGRVLLAWLRAAE